MAKLKSWYFEPRPSENWIQPSQREYRQSLIQYSQSKGTATKLADIFVSSATIFRKKKKKKQHRKLDMDQIVYFEKFLTKNFLGQYLY